MFTLRMTITGMALAWLCASGPVLAQSAQDAATNASPASSVKLSNVFMALPAGEQWLSLRVGLLLCASSPITETSSGGRIAQTLPPYQTPFKTEMERAGYKVVTPGEDNLFEPGAASSDYDVAAVVTAARIDGCVSSGSVFNSVGDVRGDGSMKIDWQLYSRMKKQVVARVSTTGTAKLTKSVPGGVTRLVVESFASNVRELAATPDFRTAMSASNGLAKENVQPGQQSKIALLGSRKAPPRKVDEAVGSVVMLDTGTGIGSGLLVSDDGYILTNAHVVGDAKSLQVRWSDGIERPGEVVRVAKARDIALVKSEARDRIPLAIKRGAVTPGQRVYAIGTPKDKRFQSTVSSGIVSANRVIDGLRFIQSDTAVSPGSSGGALLDETGSVIGVTVSGYQNDGPAGLNMFIPIGDALDFLSLEQN